MEEDPEAALANEIVATKRTMLETVRAICKRAQEKDAGHHESTDLLGAARMLFECVMENNELDGDDEDDEDD